jgi:cobalt-zinc-cadmium efflux system outer membrane protein
MAENRMFQKKTTCAIWVVALSVLTNVPLWAQNQPQASAPITLQQAFNMAWERQPEAQSLETLHDAADARRRTANAWTAEPPALELSGKTDQALKNDGTREYVAGVALPLWLPGERSRLGSLAEAESNAVSSRATAARLRTAAAVRDAWWQWLHALGEQALARERLNNARRLADDVARRSKAGDLARADQHQAEGAAATAEVALAEAEAALATTSQQLRALIGTLPAEGAVKSPEAIPAVPDDFTALDAAHPAVAELFDRAEVARRVADLSSVQTRNNPELVLAATRERGALGDAYQQSVTLGVRIPFGSKDRNRAKVGLARAEAIETESQLRLERERLAASLEAARVRVGSANAQLAAAEKRASLARESRGFFDKSFRLGESDLPIRLRIELEAAEAERQASRARIDLAIAISALRQAMGLLPEQGSSQ